MDDKVTTHHQINYLEIPSKDIEATKRFFSQVFGWSFVDYGPDYCSFGQGGIDGGFFKSGLCMSTAAGGALIVLYSDDLAATQAKIEGTGGKVVKPVFTFPGGRRFHFTDPAGNEFAVWSK